MNKDEINKLGKERQDAHPTGTKRYYKDPNIEDTIGMAGEIALGERYNLKPDFEIRPNGDDHIDFEIILNDTLRLTIDVKTANKAYNLLIKEWEINKCADILVLAQYNNGDVEFKGWTLNTVMQKQPTKVFSSLGITNYYLHSNKLYPMEKLDLMFSMYTIKQIDATKP